MKRIVIALLIITPYLTKAQGHALGAGVGIDLFGFAPNINYQYTYKLLNLKTKVAYIPQGLFYVPNNSIVNDYYLGIQTQEGKKVIFTINTGITILHVPYQNYYSEIYDQINPIQNFNLAFCINPQHRITTDLSISSYTGKNFSKYGGTKHNGLRLTFEVGYSYRFKQKHKTDTNKETG